MPAPQQSTTTGPGLVRDLGTMHAASVVIGVVVGSGIFLVPAEMMKDTGSTHLVFLAWIVGGLFSFCGWRTGESKASPSVRSRLARSGKADGRLAGRLA